MELRLDLDGTVLVVSVVVNVCFGFARVQVDGVGGVERMVGEQKMCYHMHDDW